MDGRGSRGSRGALYRRTRSRLSRNRQKLTQTLCRTAATVSERDGGLLGKRHGRSALLCRVRFKVMRSTLSIRRIDGGSADGDDETQRRGVFGISREAP